MSRSDASGLKDRAAALPAGRITLEAFRKFRDFFYAKTGIYFDDSKRYFVDRRLLERMHQTATEDFKNYFSLLRFELSGVEFQALVNLMTTNETYFFREEYQFKALTASMLPELVRGRTKAQPLRIWSVPSASGEEPYSIAMYLLEYWREVDEYEIELLASDIDTHMLQQARTGIYAPRALQYLPPPLVEKYFRPLPTGEHQISADLRDSVTFSTVNIKDLGQTVSFRDIDVIFCRNLFIYFDDLSRREAAEMFYEVLRPGGFICLGHSESMSRISPLFDARRFPEGIVYQKPERLR